MDPKFVRLGLRGGKRPNLAQWTFQGGAAGWTWQRTAADGTIIQASAGPPLPTLELAKQDATLAGWTPKQATVAFHVG